MKKLICKQLIFSLNGEGSLANALIQYKVDEDGIISREYRSIGVMSAVNIPAMNAHIALMRKVAENAEGI